MAPRTLRTLFAAALATSGVHAGPCKPSLGTSSIVSFSSTFSRVETWSTTEILSSAVPTTTTTDILSTATNTESTSDGLSTTETHSTTETRSTTFFESTASTETTTAPATTSSVCIPTCSQGQQAVLKDTFPDPRGCGRQVAPWNLKDSFKIIPDKDIPFSECANECASNCHCKSFVWDYTCSQFSGTYAEMNPGEFYLGPAFYDVGTCLKCEEAESTTRAQSTTETITTAEVESTTTEAQSTTDAQSTTLFESTTSTETTTAAATTTTEASSAPCLSFCPANEQIVLRNPAPNMCGLTYAVGLLPDSVRLGTLPLSTVADCANACSNNCHCKSFAQYQTNCYLYSGTFAELNPPYAYYGYPYYDMATCYYCDD